MNTNSPEEFAASMIKARVKSHVECYVEDSVQDRLDDMRMKYPEQYKALVEKMAAENAWGSYCLDDSTGRRLRESSIAVAQDDLQERIIKAEAGLARNLAANLINEAIINPTNRVKQYMERNSERIMAKRKTLQDVYEFMGQSTQEAKRHVAEFEIKIYNLVYESAKNCSNSKNKSIIDIDRIETYE
jgi:hypothetical protein